MKLGRKLHCDATSLMIAVLMAGAAQGALLDSIPSGVTREGHFSFDGAAAWRLPEPTPVLSYSTLLDNQFDEESGCIAVDAAGHAYVASFTYGSSESSRFTTRFGSGRGLAVTKIKADGSGVLYSTFISGGRPKGIAVDGQGNVYVTGQTDDPAFPVTNAVQAVFADGDPMNAFVFKLDPSGSQLVFSTFLGGSGHDEGTGVAVDGAGNIYVTGSTYSGDFLTANPLQSQLGGPADAFVVKLSASGLTLLWSTYLGGSGVDLGHGIVIDGSGNLCLVGETISTNFPTTAGAFQKNLAGALDVYIAKLKADGSALLLSTYLGGGLSDFARGIAADAAGNLVVVGATRSANFPTTNNAFQRQWSGGDGQDAFVAKLNAAGTGLIYATFLGGSMDDEAAAVAVDSSGNAYVTGTTQSSDFPVAMALKPIKREYERDAFVTKLNADGSALSYSTLLGSSSPWEYGDDLAVDAAGNAYVIGSVGGALYPPYFPTTAGAYQADFGDRGGAAFVTKIAEVVGAPANDDFANAFTLSGTRITTLAINANANPELGEPNHAGIAGGKSLWWRWVAPTNGHLIVSTAGSDFDTVLAVYTGETISQAVSMAANDNESEEIVTSRLRFPVAAGTAYFVAVDGKGGATGSVVLSLSFSLPPNDDLANSTPISGLPATATGSNVDATIEDGEQQYTWGAKSVWWSWTAATNGSVTVTAVGDGFNTVLAIYTGASMSELRAVGYNDTDRGPGSRVTFKSRAGSTYKIIVFGASFSSGSITLTLAPAQSPANDDFANRKVLEGLNVTDLVSNRDATFEEHDSHESLCGITGEVFCYPAGQTVWWSWTAPTNGQFLITTTGSQTADGQAFNSRLAIFTGDTTTNLIFVAGNNDASSTLVTSRLLLDGVADTTYQILVDGSPYSDAGEIHLNINQVAPPAFLPGSWKILPGGQFQALLRGVPEKTYVVESSTNLVDWTSVATNTATSNPIQLSDTDAASFPGRFYRARLLPAP